MDGVWVLSPEDSDGDNGKDEALGAIIRRCIRAAGGCLTRDVGGLQYRTYMVRDIHVGELQVTVQADSRRESQPQRRAPASARAPAVKLECVHACIQPAAASAVGCFERRSNVGKLFRDPQPLLHANRRLRTRCGSKHRERPSAFFA